jgi:hypothetical protein
MPKSIENIEAANAPQILRVLVRSIRSDQAAPELTPELQKELASAFGLSQTATEPASEAELARQALVLLADDTDKRSAIEALVAQTGPVPQKFDFGASLAVTAAVMIVLQTHVRFERREDGKWNVKVEKKPTSDALLKGLVQKLLGFIK